MFCVECGREGPLYDGLCAECFLKKNRFTEIDDHLDLMRCSHCSAFLVGGEWKDFEELEQAASELAVGSMRVRRDASLGEVELTVTPLDRNNLRVEIGVEVLFQDLSKLEDLSTTVRVKRTSCPRCSKMMGSYFESIIQVRSRDRKMDPEEKEEVLRAIEEGVERVASANRDLFISKVEELHGGFDVYLSSNSLGRSITKELAAMYAAETKESSSLVGKREGKDVYRITFLVRLPAYRIHDIVSYHGRIYWVEGISAQSTRLRGLSDHSSVTFSNDDLKAAKVRGREEDIMEAVLVSQTDQEVQLLHPMNYATVEVKKPPGYSAMDDVVSVFCFEEELYLVPE